jgi:hypothetical protein
LKAISLFKKGLTSLGEFSVTREFAKADGFLDVVQFLPCEEGFVEGDKGFYDLRLMI